MYDIKSGKQTVNKINIAQFKSDLAKSSLITNPSSDPISLYNQYHSTLSSLINKHAPLKTKSVSSRPKEPWMSEEVLAAKREKRRLERAWRRTKFTFDRQCLTRQVHHYNNLLSQAKGDWYTSMISQNENKPRNLWNCINRILHRSQSSPLPDCSDYTSLANDFGKYFEDKIDNIRAILNSSDCKEEQTKPHYTPPNLSHFNTVSEDEVRKLMSSSPNKSCNLDPCPTSIVKDCVDLLVGPITSIINMSLSNGIFPGQFKQALVTPLLKKSSLPKNVFKNYRPVSNLNYVSKLMEKVV